MDDNKCPKCRNNYWAGRNDQKKIVMRRLTWMAAGFVLAVEIALLVLIKIS